MARVVASGGVFARYEREHRRLANVRVGSFLQQVVVESKHVVVRRQGIDSLPSILRVDARVSDRVDLVVPSEEQRTRVVR